MNTAIRVVGFIFFACLIKAERSLEKRVIPTFPVGLWSLLNAAVCAFILELELHRLHPLSTLLVSRVFAAHRNCGSSGKYTPRADLIIHITRYNVVPSQKWTRIAVYWIEIAKYFAKNAGKNVCRILSVGNIRQITSHMFIPLALSNNSPALFFFFI